jgi:hypothetical protein
VVLAGSAPPGRGGGAQPDHQRAQRAAPAPRYGPNGLSLYLRPCAQARAVRALPAGRTASLTHALTCKLQANAFLADWLPAWGFGLAPARVGPVGGSRPVDP